MASTNFTTHYSIPLPLGTDLTTPMDYNEAAEAVDTALFAAETDAGNASEAAADAVDTVAGDLSQEKAKIVALQTRMTNAENEIDDVRVDSSDMITAYNEPTATASHAYAIGDFFIYNNTLYKATAAIAIGATIVPDTNCETTNVSSELIGIKSDLSGKADTSILIEDVTSNFSFGSVFTSMTRKAVIVNNNILIVHIDGYKEETLPVAENSHFCTISSAVLNRIPTGNHAGYAWSSGSNPHVISIAKDSNGLAYTERSGAFQYLSSDLIFILS